MSLPDSRCQAHIPEPRPRTPRRPCSEGRPGHRAAVPESSGLLALHPRPEGQLNRAGGRDSAKKSRLRFWLATWELLPACLVIGNSQRGSYPHLTAFGRVFDLRRCRRSAVDLCMTSMTYASVLVNAPTTTLLRSRLCGSPKLCPHTLHSFEGPGKSPALG